MAAQVQPPANLSVGHLPTTAGAPPSRAQRAAIINDVTSIGFWEDLTQSKTATVIPIWSSPGLDPNSDEFFDGIAHRKRFLAQRQRRMQPAFGPDDAIQNPTEYARLFGIRPELTRDGFGHSGMTPTHPDFQTSVQSAEDDEVDRGFQRFNLNMYDSIDLATQGALNPRLQTTWPPTLQEPIHPLLDRHRWTQANLVIPVVQWGAAFNVSYGPGVDGIGGQYDAGTNDKLWLAMQPALQLASMVLRSEHPYWQAMTSIFHLRPVDASKDGRSDEQRAEQGNVPWSSVWVNGDDPTDARVPAPYAGQQRLAALGFGPEQCRALCMGILDEVMRFSFLNHIDMMGALTIDQSADTWGLRMVINPEYVWPLLVPPDLLPDSVKAAYTFQLSANILHELSHACARTLQMMTTRDDILRLSAAGASLSDDVIRELVSLGDEIFGPRQTHNAGYLTRPAFVNQFFAEDGPQGEEGLNFEKFLWGHIIHASPPVLCGFSSLAPVS